MCSKFLLLFVSDIANFVFVIVQANMQRVFDFTHFQPT